MPLAAAAGSSDWTTDPMIGCTSVGRVEICKAPADDAGDVEQILDEPRLRPASALDGLNGSGAL